jgi:hypothetical protein
MRSRIAGLYSEFIRILNIARENVLDRYVFWLANPDAVDQSIAQRTCKIVVFGECPWSH